MKPLYVSLVVLAVIGIVFIAWVALRNDPVSGDLRDAGQGVQRGARDAVDGVKDAAQDAKDTIKDATR